MDHREYGHPTGEITRQFALSDLGLGVVGFVTSGLASLGFGVWVILLCKDPQADRCPVSPRMAVWQPWTPGHAEHSQMLVPATEEPCVPQRNTVNLLASPGEVSQERTECFYQRGCWTEGTVQCLPASRKLWTGPLMGFTQCSFIVVECGVFLKAFIDSSPALDPLASASEDPKCFSCGFSLWGLQKGCCATCSPGCVFRQPRRCPRI